MTLNAAQQAAVDSTAVLRVVIAGPGSGKTRTMVEAVKRARGTVAIMTFTNAGANEFRNRLKGESDGAGGYTGLDHLAERRLAYCGTLHGYCFRLIQKFGDLLGYIPGKVGILPDKERIPRLLACRDKLGVKITEKRLLEVRGSFIGEQEKLIWKEYEFLLKRNNLVDYDRILQEGSELLQMPIVRAQVKLDYLFVDEFQDSAIIDQQIYGLIPAKSKMFVGDPDQSIFAFRGANPYGLVSLVETIGRVSLASGPEIDCEVHKLELNYRSDGDICDTANRLIAHNQARVHKDILPVSTDPGQVHCNGFEEVGQELASIVHTLRLWKWGERGMATVAVLYRMNHDVKVCRDYLKAMGVPVYELKWEQRPPDWERALLLLGLCLSPENEIIAERYLRLEKDQATIDKWKLEDQASGLGFTLSERVLKGRHGPSESRAQFLAKNGVSESTILFIQTRQELLSPDADLADLLHDLHSNEETKASFDAGVYVGTIHSAKGREWDVVFLPAFEQGIIPTVSGPDVLNPGPKIEEERRLAFVAVTRARHELYISHCGFRKGQWGAGTVREPSQFIREMGLIYEQ